MIHLLDIDPGNWRIDLAVSEAQKPFVSDRAKLLARAYARLKHIDNTADKRVIHTNYC